jgi:opacity protein-like surface antigen
MFFLGDLGGNKGLGKGTWLKDVMFPLTKFSKGVYINIYPAEWLGFRVAANHSKVEGYDSVIKDNGGLEMYRKQRNLEFRSQIWEVYGGVEIYPTVFFEKYDGLQGKFRPYGFVGIGAFKFNPKARFYNESKYTSQWVELKPLRLEGQGMAEYPERKEYSLTQMSVPLGFGFKYYIKENMYIGLEILHRQTFTDYIDDVSTSYIDDDLFQNYLTPEQTTMANQLHYRIGYHPFKQSRTPNADNQRGDATQNDAFFSSMLRFGWRLNDWNSPNGRALRQMRCPAYY